ncbi:MAG TPA: alpha/beta fold hydrolase [Dermatophilaceae bacterium]|nr:alpha/beta fold hydrolase [Dermatophilaceae bacterium]
MPVATQWRTATEQIPVSGGELSVARLSTAVSPTAPPVLALHGITGNALAWLPLAQLLTGRLTLWAPDLRGRAASRHTLPSHGLTSHADDVVATMDHLGIDRAVLVGHSMGASVGTLVAARHPERVAGLLMVDGGLTSPLPAGTDVDAFQRLVLGPAIERLSMTFAGLAEYLAWWSIHPGLGPSLLGPYRHFVQAYLAADLVRDGAAYRSSCNREAVHADGASMVTDEEVLSAPWTSLAAGVPMHLLWAPRGALNQPLGPFGAARPTWFQLPDGLSAERVEANHYSVIFEPTAARRVAHRVLETAGLAR